jgi:hypothetical protein
MAQECKNIVTNNINLGTEDCGCWTGCFINSEPAPFFTPNTFNLPVKSDVMPPIRLGNGRVAKALNINYCGNQPGLPNFPGPKVHSVSVVGINPTNIVCYYASNPVSGTIENRHRDRQGRSLGSTAEIISGWIIEGDEDPNLIGNFKEVIVTLKIVENPQVPSSTYEYPLDTRLFNMNVDVLADGFQSPFIYNTIVNSLADGLIIEEFFPSPAPGAQTLYDALGIHGMDVCFKPNQLHPYNTAETMIDSTHRYLALGLGDGRYFNPNMSPQNRDLRIQMNNLFNLSIVGFSAGLTARGFNNTTCQVSFDNNMKLWILKIARTVLLGTPIADNEFIDFNFDFFGYKPIFNDAPYISGGNEYEPVFSGSTVQKKFIQNVAIIPNAITSGQRASTPVPTPYNFYQYCQTPQLITKSYFMAAHNNRVSIMTSAIPGYNATYKNTLANKFYRMTFLANKAGEYGAPNITSIPTQICN